jgi:preprotein translocase SecE subunit
MSFNQYIKDTKSELKHVAWPTQTQTIVYTALVIGVSLIVAMYIGLFDFFFVRGLEGVIGSGGGANSALETTQQPSLPEGFDINVIPETEHGDVGTMQVITNEPASAEQVPEAN